eukprot:1159998-Pelagomonas_calceolata.AAC.2
MFDAHLAMSASKFAMHLCPVAFVCSVPSSRPLVQDHTPAHFTACAPHLCAGGHQLPRHRRHSPSERRPRPLPSRLELQSASRHLHVTGGKVSISAGQKEERDRFVAWTCLLGCIHDLRQRPGEVLRCVWSRLCMEAIITCLFPLSVQAIITKEDGGHSSCIIAITVLGPYMFTTDFDGTILVWDLTAGKVTQSLTCAHDGPIMQLLVYESHMLSAGIDGVIKVWEVLSSPAPGMVLKPEPDFVFDKDKSEEGPRRAKLQRPGILAMAGTSDPAGTPILMVRHLNVVPLFRKLSCTLLRESCKRVGKLASCFFTAHWVSFFYPQAQGKKMLAAAKPIVGGCFILQVSYNGEKCVRLFELPSFSSRGYLVPVSTMNMFWRLFVVSSFTPVLLPSWKL